MKSITVFALMFAMASPLLADAIQDHYNKLPGDVNTIYSFDINTIATIPIFDDLSAGEKPMTKLNEEMQKEFGFGIDKVKNISVPMRDMNMYTASMPTAIIETPMSIKELTGYITATKPLLTIGTDTVRMVKVTTISSPKGNDDDDYRYGPFADTVYIHQFAPGLLAVGNRDGMEWIVDPVYTVDTAAKIFKYLPKGKKLPTAWIASIIPQELREQDYGDELPVPIKEIIGGFAAFTYADSKYNAEAKVDFNTEEAANKTQAAIDLATHSLTTMFSAFANDIRDAYTFKIEEKTATLTIKFDNSLIVKIKNYKPTPDSDDPSTLFDDNDTDGDQTIKDALKEIENRQP